MTITNTDQKSGLDRIDMFAVSYWTAAVLQLIGTYNVFNVYGGEGFRGFMHGVSGALCFELVILAVNAYGVKQTGAYRGLLLVVSLALIMVSCMIQIADLGIESKREVKNALDSFMMVVVPSAPSVAMFVTTVIKFVGAGKEIANIVESDNAKIGKLMGQVSNLNDALLDKDMEIERVKSALEEARNRPVLQQAFLTQAVPTQTEGTESQTKVLLNAGISASDNLGLLVDQALQSGKTNAEATKWIVGQIGDTSQTFYNRVSKRVSRARSKYESASG